jgi:hypothetical protein
MSHPINILSQLCIFFIAASMLTTACNTPTPIKEANPVSSMGPFVKATNPTATHHLEIVTSPTSTSSQTIQHSQTPSPTITPTSTSSSTATPTVTPSATPTPTLSPTYAILRGTVLEQANCRYGPGAAYLYKYGLYPENNLEIIGRNETGTWIVIQAIGGKNPCWVKASLLDIKGDVMSLAPASLPLPQSPYYGPLTGVSAQRSGDSVVISWSPLILRAGDDSLQYPYLIEAWLCQAGQLTFTPIGSWETIVTVQDESGCSEPSHARVFGVEKHGYTNWIEIPWPQP